MIVKLLAKHHLEFLSLKGGCRGSSESTLVKMSNCSKSHALAHYYMSESWVEMLTKLYVALISEIGCLVFILRRESIAKLINQALCTALRLPSL